MSNLPRHFWASVSARGQVTIPAEVRRALDLTVPDKVVFRMQGDTVTLTKQQFLSIAELAGSVPPLKEPKTWQKIRELVDEERAEAFWAKLKRERGG